MDTIGKQQNEKFLCTQTVEDGYESGRSACIMIMQDTVSVLPLERRRRFIANSIGLPRPPEGAKVVSAGGVLSRWSFSYALWWFDAASGARSNLSSR